MIVGSCSTTYQQFDVIRVGVRNAQQLLTGFSAHVRSAETFLIQDMTVSHADMCHNPFVVGIHHLRQLLIGEYVVWQIASDSCDYSINFFHEVLFQSNRFKGI